MSVNKNNTLLIISTIQGGFFLYYKTTLWECFGDIIIDNLKQNIKDKTFLCDRCGKRVELTGNKSKYCSECARKVEQENWAERKRKQRIREKCHEIENR